MMSASTGNGVQPIGPHPMRTTHNSALLSNAQLSPVSQQSTSPISRFEQQQHHVAASYSQQQMTTQQQQQQRLTLQTISPPLQQSSLAVNEQLRQHESIYSAYSSPTLSECSSYPSFTQPHPLCAQPPHSQAAASAYLPQQPQQESRTLSPLSEFALKFNHSNVSQHGQGGLPFNDSSYHHLHHAPQGQHYHPSMSSASAAAAAVAAQPHIVTPFSSHPHSLHAQPQSMPLQLQSQMHAQANAAHAQTQHYQHHNTAPHNSQLQTMNRPSQGRAYEVDSSKPDMYANQMLAQPMPLPTDVASNSQSVSDQALSHLLQQLCTPTNAADASLLHSAGYQALLQQLLGSIVQPGRQQPLAPSTEETSALLHQIQLLAMAQLQQLNQTAASSAKSMIVQPLPPSPPPQLPMPWLLPAELMARYSPPSTPSPVLPAHLVMAAVQPMTAPSTPSSSQGIDLGQNLLEYLTVSDLEHGLVNVNRLWRFKSLHVLQQRRANVQVQLALLYLGPYYPDSLLDRVFSFSYVSASARRPSLQSANAMVLSNDSSCSTGIAAAKVLVTTPPSNDRSLLPMLHTATTSTQLLQAATHQAISNSQQSAFALTSSYKFPAPSTLSLPSALSSQASVASQDTPWNTQSLPYPSLQSNNGILFPFSQHQLPLQSAASERQRQSALFTPSSMVATPASAAPYPFFTGSSLQAPSAMDLMSMSSYGQSSNGQLVQGLQAFSQLFQNGAPSIPTSSTALVPKSPSSSHKGSSKKKAREAALLASSSFNSVIDCGYVDPSSSLRYFRQDSMFFGKSVEIYTALNDPHQTLLYRASALAEMFSYATNKVGMYLSRRRLQMGGIYQATGFLNKPSGRTGLKCGGYFLTMKACQEFENHFRHGGLSEEQRRAPATIISPSHAQLQLDTTTSNRVLAVTASMPARPAPRFSFGIDPAAFVTAQQSKPAVVAAPLPFNPRMQQSTAVIHQAVANHEAGTKSHGGIISSVSPRLELESNASPIDATPSSADSFADASSAADLSVKKEIFAPRSNSTEGHESTSPSALALFDSSLSSGECDNGSSDDSASSSCTQRLKLKAPVPASSSHVSSPVIAGASSSFTPYSSSTALSARVRNRDRSAESRYQEVHNFSTFAPSTSSGSITQNFKRARVNDTGSDEGSSTPPDAEDDRVRKMRKADLAITSSGSGSGSGTSDDNDSDSTSSSSLERAKIPSSSSHRSAFQRLKSLRSDSGNSSSTIGTNASAPLTPFSTSSSPMSSVSSSIVNGSSQRLMTWPTQLLASPLHASHSHSHRHNHHVTAPPSSSTAVAPPVVPSS